MKTSSSLNHTFRLVWNDHHQGWVAVPETARGRGKRRSSARALLAAVLLAGAGAPALALDAGALPTGGRVVDGQATLSQHGTQLLVQQASARAVLDWTQFNIGADAQVRFVQPDATSAALNRVRGGEASLILGRLESNGQVWLLNPGGVVFGRTAQVDVGGLVASSLAISDEDFMAGRLRLQAGAQAGEVRNEGRLTAARGGVIALVAPQVVQRGEVQAPGGSALLGAGERVTLDFAGDGLLQLSVDRAALDAHIEQAGTLSADGGLVQLSAHAASALRASVINTDGLLQARSLGERGGRIVLDGGELGIVQVAGTLDASATTGRGGDIQVTGQHIRLRGATLTADGDSGGGRVRVGGGWQGADTALFNATTVDADAGSSASVSARTRGDGGEIVFWADDTTRFAGQVTARGGAGSGDGGRMEVSGQQVLQYSGRADALAPHGRTGDLLLDPATIDVVVGTATGSVGGSVVTVADLEAQNANVLLEATGRATIGDLSANGGDGRLTMQPNVSLRIEAGTSGNGNLNFANPANTIEVSGTGSIMFVAGRTGSGQLLTIGNLVASGTGSNPGSLPTHNVTILGNGTPSAGSITLFGADGITVTGALTTQGGYVRLWGDSDNASGGGLTLSSPITTNGGHLHLSTGTGAIVMNSNMTLGSGRIFFRADGTHTTGSRQLGGVLSASGDVSINTTFQMNAGASILTDGVIRLSSTVNLNTGAGALTLRGSAIDFTGATLQNLSTASMRLEPADPTTNMVLGDASGFASAGTLASLPGIRNLTIGRADGTGTITVPSGGFSFNANGTLEVVNNTVTISGGSLVNTSGNVTITADNINIGQSVSANGGVGKVTLRQQTAGNSLNLGGGLTNASIGNISAAILAVGRADGGDLVFDNDISTTATSVHLLSGSRVLGVAGGVSATNLAVTAGAGAEISDSTFDFTTLAASLGGSGSQTTSITSSAASWGLGTVDGVAGLQVQTGSAPVITLQATTALTANAAVNFANTAARLNLRAPSITSSGATVSNRGNATVSFDRIGAGAWGFGGAGDNVSAASLAAFGGTGFIELGSATTELTAGGAVSLAVGNTFTVQGLTLTGLSGTNTLATTAGSLKVAAADGALQIDANLSAASRLVLETTGTHGITGSGTLSASTLAVRAPGGAVSLPATHQVGTLAATVRDLSLVNGRALVIGTVDGIAGVDATNTLDLRLTGASSHLTLQQPVAAGGAGVALLLETPGRFVNSAGASALSAVNGVWRVYSANPADDTRGGLAPDFKQYAATTASTVLGTGNGFLYSTAPTLTVSLTGTTSKVYDRTVAATLDASHYALAGAIDGDTLAITAGTEVFDTRDMGTGKTVTADGYSVTATNGSIPVYGYALANTSASAAIGTITARSLTVAPSLVASKVYDGTTTASVTPGSLSGDIAGDTLVVSATGSFDTPNAGTGKTVAVGLSLSGADAGNYSLSTSSQTVTGDITPKSLSIGAPTVASKVYDGNTTASVTPGSLSGLVGSDTVGVSATGSFDNRHAGIGKLVSIGLVLTGADAGNYSLATPSLSATGDITPKSLGIGASTVASKVYDGTSVASVTPGLLSGLIGGDTVGVDATGSFDNRHVGTGKAVSIGLALTGADAGNYSLSTLSQSATGDITPRALSVAASTVASKVYDGTTAASVTPGSLSGGVSGDTLVVSASGSFDTPNAGTGKTVNVGLTLSGADAGNYSLSTSSQTVTGDITPKSLSIGAPTVASKVYDGTTVASVTPGLLSGLIGSDTVGVSATGSFDNRNAGIGKMVSIGLALTGADAGNYSLATPSLSATGDITPKSLGIGAPTVATKVYDGTTVASVTPGLLSGLIGSDTVGVNATGSFDNRNAGIGKLVSIGLALTGADAGNYSLATPSLSATADITPKSLSIGAPTVATKVYDGSTVASVTPGLLSGLVGSDTVGVNATGSFDNRHAGIGKMVSIGLVLTGADAGNYSLATPSLSATGDITPKSLGIGAPTVATKVYDGTTVASVTPGLLSGLVGSDTVGVNATGSFDNRNAGIGKMVSIGLVLTGADAGNYSLATPSLSATGDITPKSLGIGAPTVATKVYDGNTTASVTPGSLSGLVGSDTVGVNATGSFDNRNVGTGKLVSIGLALTGADAGNYSLATPSLSATGDITPKSLGIGAPTVATKVYDGNTTASVTPGLLSGLVSSDTVGVNATGSFDNRNAGIGKMVSIGLVLTGADAGNYSLATPSLSATGDITPKSLGIGAPTVAAKVYDGNTTASVTPGLLSGLVGSDTVGVNATGSFDNRNAGTGKLVSIGLALTGADAGNYSLATPSLSATADITPKSLSIGAPTVATKVYDGSTVASVTPGLLSGLVGGDTVGVSATGSFDNRNVGTGKPVSIGLALTGADAGNYSLTTPSLSATGDIAPKTLTVTALAVAPKLFDGMADATVSLFQVSGLVEGDQVQSLAQARFGDATVGVNKPVSITSVLLTGADGGNYRIDLAGLSTTADLLPPPAGAAQSAVVASPPAGNGTAGGAAPGAGPAAGSGGSGGVPSTAGAGSAGSAAGSPPTLIETAGAPREGGAPAGAGSGGAVATGSSTGTAAAAGGTSTQDRGTTGTQPTLGLEQVLSGDGRISVATGQPPQALQVGASIAVTEARGGAAPRPVGQFRVADLGDSLSLTPVPMQQLAMPPADGRVRHSGEALVALDAGVQATMRFVLTEEGLLRATVSREAAGQTPDTLAALAIATLKRSTGIAASEVRALALVIEE